MSFSISGHVGRRIGELRVARGLRQADLAEWLGVTPQAVSHYEAGKIHITVDRAYSASKALGVGVAELFEGIEE